MTTGYPAGAGPYMVTNQNPASVYQNSGDAAPPFPSAQSPTAPNISDMETVPGYENCTFDNSFLQPPTIPDWRGKPPPEREIITDLPSLTDEEVRDAIAQHISENCCYGKEAGRDMRIKDVHMSSAFHYTLETFGETRESAWRFEPYTGQSIDGPVNGPAPAPWDVMVLPQQYFQDAKSKMEVPHTAFVKPCHICLGNGRTRCDQCFGNGQQACTWCNGSGRRNTSNSYEQCTSCNSSGHTRCIRCSGMGQVKCKTCSGKGNLKGFVELTVSWKNSKEDYISETSTLPKELIRDVSGKVMFQEQSPKVWPITHSADRLVNEASNNLVMKHSSAFPNQRILQQRHQLRIVPIGQCNFEWKSKSGIFYVFGFEHKVYFPDYPQSCCWGCNIL